MMTTGMVTTTEAAMIAVIGDWNCDWPVKNVSAAGTVRARSVEVSDAASRNSFQQKKNVRIAVVKTPGAASGTITLRNACHARRPVDLGRLLHLPRDLAEERRHRPDRERQGERQVGDDQPDPRVVDAQPAPHVEQRSDERGLGEHGDRQRHRQQHLLQRELEAGDGVGGEHRDDHRDQRWRGSRCRTSCAGRR